MRRAGLMHIEITVNGERKGCDIRPADSLLAVLRGPLEMSGAKNACERGECGACTVLVGGRSVMACVTLAACVREPVETIEGLAEEARRLREAFADCGAFQCSYCTPGMIVRGVELMRSGLPSTDAELRRELSGNLCRCTGYQSIVEALRQADSGRKLVDKAPA